MKTLNSKQTDSQQGTPSESGPAGASSLAYGLTRLMTRLIMPLFVNLRTEGLENVPENGPVILAMNHIHWFDILLASVRVPRILHYMAKIELFGAPVFGGYIRMMGAFPVRRGEGDREALRIGESLLAEGKVLVIFPEGHRSGNGVLQKAHPGAGYIAMRTGAPVVAVGISGTQYMLKKFRPTVTIRYGKPFLITSVGEKRTRDGVSQATDEIMYRIAALLPPDSRGPYRELAAAADTAKTLGS